MQKKQTKIKQASTCKNKRGGRQQPDRDKYIVHVVERETKKETETETETDRDRDRQKLQVVLHETTMLSLRPVRQYYSSTMMHTMLVITCMLVGILT